MTRRHARRSPCCHPRKILTATPSSKPAPTAAPLNSPLLREAVWPVPFLFDAERLAPRGVARVALQQSRPLFYVTSELAQLCELCARAVRVQNVRDQVAIAIEPAWSVRQAMCREKQRRRGEVAQHRVQDELVVNLSERPNVSAPQPTNERVAPPELVHGAAVPGAYDGSERRLPKVSKKHPGIRVELAC